jgi:RNA polymerase sigma-70 factor, ECF subfamily
LRRPWSGQFRLRARVFDVHRAVSTFLEDCGRVQLDRALVVERVQRLDHLIGGSIIARASGAAHRPRSRGEPPGGLRDLASRSARGLPPTPNFVPTPTRLRLAGSDRESDNFCRFDCPERQAPLLQDLSRSEEFGGIVNRRVFCRMALLKLLVPTPAAEMSDDDVVRGVRAGSEQAITLLYRRHARLVAGLAYRLLGGDDEVDDVVQQVFLTTVREANKLYGGSALKSWLYCVTTREVARQLRRRWRRQRLRHAIELVIPRFSDPAKTCSLDELYDVLEQLSPDVRLPWMLHHVEGQSLPDTAKSCRVSLATVKRRILRADQLIVRRLGDDMA